MTRILITRPEHQARSTVKALEQEGLEALQEPLLVLKKISHERADYSDYEALVFTSGNSFEFWDYERIDKALPIIAVGPRTADIAGEHGFTNITNIDGAAADVMAHLGDRRALHIGGHHISQNFGSNVDRLIVYEAEAVQALSARCKEALLNDEIDLISFYSTRTAKVFSRLIQEEGLESTLESVGVLSISENVVRSVRVLPWGVLYKSKKPNGTSMINACKRIMSDEYEYPEI